MASDTESNTESEAKFWAKSVSTILSSLNSILEKVGAVFPWIKHWLNRPVILPHQRSHWWHMGRAGDQKPAMQIVSYWYVTNRMDQPIKILNAYIKKPRTSGHISLKDVHSVYHGSYPVPPRTTTDLHANFWIHPPFCKEGKDFKVDIVFVDQYGQKRMIKNVEFKSDKRKGPGPVKLTEEAVYQLEHEIEKKIAAVLKDEINRYKKYGRRSGELGSIYALHNSRKIKSIYQDSWTSDRSGERQEIVNDHKEAEVHSENGDALVELFNGLADQADKELFINSLISRLNRDKEYYCVSYLILYILFRIGRLNAALDAAKISLQKKRKSWGISWQKISTDRLLEEHQRYGFSDFLAIMNGMLRFEHQSFTDREMDIVEEFIAGIDEHAFQINEKINSD
jgi:hypothetical protein